MRLAIMNQVRPIKNDPAECVGPTDAIDDGGFHIATIE